MNEADTPTTDRASRELARHSYDSECERLAEHFLADFSGIYPLAVKDLAQTIQEAVEDWLRPHIEGPAND